MSIAFWVWLGVLVVMAVIEMATMELVSIWFTIGAIPPFIMSAIMGNTLWEVQVAVFVVVSALCIIFLRKLTKKWLFKNSNEKTNTEALIGRKLRMLERTDFETVGSAKVNDVVWSAVAENGDTIEKGEVVEIVNIQGNKLIVKAVKEKPAKLENNPDRDENSQKTAEVKKGGEN